MMLKCIAALCCALALGIPGSGLAQTPGAEPRLTLVVGYTSGAIYDTYARLVARHLGRHLPGSPTVVVQNMPGAGSLRSANYIYNVAPKDGSTIGLFARGMAMQALLDPQGVQYDALKFNWLGSTSRETSVVLSSAASPFRVIEDAQKHEMVVSASGSGADSMIFPAILNGVIGTKFKIVTGYPGNAEMLLAVERGEAHGNAGTSWVSLVALKPDWIREKRINVLLQLATKKHPDLPQVPLAYELARSNSDRRVLDLIFSRLALAYPFVAPPGLPPERLATLRTAFEATMRDPEFLGDARRQNLDIDPVGGEEIGSIVRQAFANPEDVIKRAQAAYEAGKIAK